MDKFESEYYRKNHIARTTDNWHPSINGMFVRVSTMPLFAIGDQPRMYRVCVWGGDDFGVEKDFENQNDADFLYDKLCSMAFVDIETCYSYGMVPA